MKKLLFAFLIFAFIFAFASPGAKAACHVITAAGSGAKTGADWNNAFAGPPGTLVRGDTYYFADGTYGSYSFSQAVSSTLIITFKKAIATDNCTSTGFNTSTMGSAQAIFTCSSIACFGVASSYFTMDGNRQSAAGSQGCGAPAGAGTADCGFLIQMTTGCTGGGNDCWGFYNNGATAGNVTIRSTEVVGNGDAGNPTFVDRQFRLTTGASAWIIQNDYIHDSAAVPILVAGGTNVIIDHNYIWKNKDSTSSHAQGIQLGPGAQSAIVVSYNGFKDIEGVGVVVGLDAGPGSSVNGMAFYGNTVETCPSNCNSRAEINNALIACINAVTCSNWTVYDNDFVNQCYDQTAGQHCGMFIQTSTGASGSIIAKNNIWYNTNGQTPAFAGGSGGTITEDYNSFLQTAGTPGSGAHDINSTSATPNPFVTWPTNGFGNFNLASDNANWNNRISLGLPYDTDANGNAFTSDRGAYQFSGTPPSNPAVTFSPTSLTFASGGLPGQTVTLTNSGTGNLVLSSALVVTGSGASSFVLSSNGCTSGLTIIPAGTCTFVVTFVPSAAGTVSAIWSVNDNAAGSPQSGNLTGTSTTQAPAQAIFAAVPLPAATPAPILTSITPKSSYVTSSGCSQDGKTFTSTCPIAIFCSNCSTSTLVTFDGTTIVATAVKTGEIDINVPLSLIPVPTASTNHTVSLSNPQTTIPVLQ